MTREEAITILKAFMENPLFSDVHKAAFNIAIHDIKAHHDWDINNLILINKETYEPAEQEPQPMVEIDLYSVIKQKYIERDVLDKIRAEIQAIIGEHNLDDYDFCSGLIVARKIIDKYRAESEVEK